MMNKKLLGTVLLFSTLFSGCKKKGENIDPIKFSLFSIDLMEYRPFSDLVAKEITKKTGVTLELINNHSDSSEAVSLMIVNNDYPDLIFAKSELSKLIEAKAVIPLDALIDNYGPNIKKLYGDELSKLKYTNENPHIYCLGTYGVKNKVYETAGNMQVQHAVLREFGYPKLSNLDEVEKALLAYKEKYPVINGHKTIGMSLLCDNWFWYVSLSNPGGYMIGKGDDGQWFVDEDNQSVVYKFLDPEMKTYYKWLNKIYHEGLLDPESFTQKEDIWRNKMENGYVLATTYPLWGISDIKNKLLWKDMADRTFAYLPVTAGSQYQDPSLKDYGFSGGWGIALTKDCKDTVRAIKFIDWICSDEGQKTINWGVEGITYFIDSTKKMHMSKIPENSGIGLWAYPFPQAGNGSYDEYGNSLVNFSLDYIRSKYSSAEKETLRAYGADMWIDLFPSSEVLGKSRHGQMWQYPLNGEMNEILQKTDDYVKTELIKIISGPEVSFDESWETMRKNIVDSDISLVSDALAVLIKEKMALWDNNK